LWNISLRLHSLRSLGRLAFAGFDDVLVTEASSFFTDDRRIASELRRLSTGRLQVAFHFLEAVSSGTAKLSSRPLDPETVRLGYELILQRHAEGEGVIAEQLAAHSSRASFIESLFTSVEWKERAPELVARAFPALQRIWHPHIPKTGGTSFVAVAVQQGCGYLNFNMINPAAGIKGVSQGFRLGSNGKILMTGHYLLPRYFSIIGPADTGLSVVRHPVERVKSMFHYVCDIMDGSTEVHQADPAPFLERGFDRNSIEQTYRNGFFVRNEQCLYLGREVTCQSALEAERRYNVTLLPVDLLDDWMRRFFPGAILGRWNISSNTKRSQTLSEQLVSLIETDSSEDLTLYVTVANRAKAGL
jgi:hypothetical protein